MKKTAFLLFAAFVSLTLLTGCAGNEAPGKELAKSIGASSGPRETEPQPDQAPFGGAITIDEDKSTPGVDVDLTVLSSTMVYAEVYNMMMEPESYVGKTVKVRGQYYGNYYEPTQQYYYFVIIADATACCEQGLEFIWLGEHTYPADYPEDQTEIEITGVFQPYDEDGITYYHIEANEVKVL